MEATPNSIHPDLFATQPSNSSRWVGPPPDRVLFIRIETDDGGSKAFRGREAQTLARLLAEGPNGISSLDHPGRRLSHYIWKIRRAGLAIEMREKQCAGAIAYSYGVYTLSAAIRVLEVREAA